MDSLSAILEADEAAALVPVTDRGVRRYYFSGSATIGGVLDPVVTVEPGATLELSATGTLAGLYVGSGSDQGGLVAQGTLAAPITFTRSGSAGHWLGVLFLSNCLDANSILDDAIVEYGGASASFPGAVYFNQCNGAITDSTVRDSARYGIYRASATPLISNITYANNALGDLF